MKKPLLGIFPKNNSNKSSKNYVALNNRNKDTIVVPEYPGWHPLHLAAYHGEYELAKTLIKEGCYVLAVDIWGRTPLHYARRRKYGSKK